MTRWPPPLRYVVPALIAATGLIAMAASTGIEVRHERQRTRRDVAARARSLGVLVSGWIEARYREEQTGRALRQVETLGLDRTLSFAAFIGSGDTVRAATDFSLEGTPAIGLAPGMREALVRVRDSGPWVTETDDQRLIGLFPVLLPSRPDELVPDQVGILMLSFDLATPLAAATRDGLRTGAILGALVVLLTIGFGLLFRSWVLGRVNRLVQATERLAAGDYTQPAPLAGSDELAAIADAVGRLARELAANADLEDQLRQTQKLEAVGQMAGGIAHDFNNILAALAGHAALALDGLDQDDPLYRDLVEMRGGIQRAANLTHQLLAFSRRQVVHPQALSLNTVSTGLKAMLDRLAGGSIRIEFELAPDLGAVHADAGQMEQILVNLVINARDAMPDGGLVTITTSETDLVEGDWGLPAGRYVRLSVRDTGPGIPADLRDRIWEPFFTTKAPGHGTGLGLSTVHGLVHQAHGAVRAINAPGGGARFDVLLPRTGPAPAPATPDRAETLPVGRGEVLLVVDDEPGLLGVTERILRRFNYEVLAATDAAAAEELFRRRDDIALLITDVLMPGIDGPTLAARLTALRPTLPVLFVSGYTDARTEDAELPTHAEFLLKPVDAGALVRTVRDLLDGGRRPAAPPPSRLHG